MKKDLSKEAKSIMAGTWNARGGRREVSTLTFLFPPPPPPLRSQERVILCTPLVNQNKEFRLIFPSQKIINVNSVLCKTIHASFSFVALLTRNTVYWCMISTITLNKAYFLHLLLIINKQLLFFLITILPHF